MSGRFLVSLTEVLSSKSILSYKILVKYDIDNTKLYCAINNKIAELLAINLHKNFLDQVVILK